MEKTVRKTAEETVKKTAEKMAEETVEKPVGETDKKAAGKMYALIVTGLSGAGKSNALSALEDLGFVCADNMPYQLVNEYLELCAKSEKKIGRVALVIDSRGTAFGYNPLDTPDEIENIKYPYEIMFLECSDEALIRRYSETRRRHPLNEDVSLGIKAERNILSRFKEKADYIIDTTDMSPVELKRTVESILLRGEMTPIRLIISSFGFKRGIPADADFVFDVRFTPNPFYIDALRHLSGRDKPVSDYVFSDENSVKFIDSIEKLIELTVPGFIRQGKKRLMVAFGCTGGRHRSAAFSEALYERLKDRYAVILKHRDLASEENSINERFVKE